MDKQSVKKEEENRIEDFCKNLVVLRQAMNWTQADLADRVGVTRQTIAAIENGKTKPSKTLFLAIVGLFTNLLPNSPILAAIAGAINITNITQFFFKK